MSKYRDADEAKEVLDKLFSEILSLPDSNKKFSDAGAVLGVYYTDPEYFVAIDGSSSPAVLVHDPDSVKPDIEIRMSSETAHTFWKGELNFPVAMMKGKAKVKGSSATVTKLLPAVAPGHEIYKALLQSQGKDHLQ